MFWLRHQVSDHFNSVRQLEGAFSPYVKVVRTNVTRRVYDYSGFDADVEMVTPSQSPVRFVVTEPMPRPLDRNSPTYDRSKETSSSESVDEASDTSDESLSANRSAGAPMVEIFLDETLAVANVPSVSNVREPVEAARAYLAPIMDGDSEGDVDSYQDEFSPMGSPDPDAPDEAYEAYSEILRDVAAPSSGGNGRL